MGPRMFRYAFCAVMASAAVMVTTPVMSQVILPSPTVIPGPATPSTGPDWLTNFGLCGYAFPAGPANCEVPVLPGADSCDSATCPEGPPPAGEVTCNAGNYLGGVTSNLNDCRKNIGTAPLNLNYAVGVDIPYRILLEPTGPSAGTCSDVSGYWFGGPDLAYTIEGVAAGTYRVGVYMLDFNGTRDQTVKACVDNAGGTELGCSSPAAVTNFASGKWALFEVALNAGDKVRMVHKSNVAQSAVVSGVFFDSIGALGCAGPACYTGVLDTVTHGDWPVAVSGGGAPYGGAGKIIFNRVGPTPIDTTFCGAIPATTLIQDFATAVTVAPTLACQDRWPGPIEGCTNLNLAMTFVWQPQQGGTEPLLCNYPFGSDAASLARGFNVPLECRHLFNDCVGDVAPATPFAAPSWDDAGERTFAAGDGPDLSVAVNVPPGSWQVCFYMVDYDNQGRAQVLEMPGYADQPVSAFTDGVTVCYGLAGGDHTLKVRSTAGPNSVISSIGWVRLDGQGNPIVDPAQCVSVGECEPCSYTQGGWGQTAKGSNVGTLRDAHFSEVYPTGLTVGLATCPGGEAGSGNVMTFSSSLAVENFLPCGGTPDALSKDYSNPTCGVAGGGALSASLKKLLTALSTNAIKNVFAAQVLGLKLNVDFSDHLTTSPDVPLGDLTITEGPFAGMTVRALLAEAEEALSCGTGDIGALNTAATNINESRDGCMEQTEFTACPVPTIAPR